MSQPIRLQSLVSSSRTLIDSFLVSHLGTDEVADVVEAVRAFDAGLEASLAGGFVLMMLLLFTLGLERLGMCLVMVGMFFAPMTAMVLPGASFVTVSDFAIVGAFTLLFPSIIRKPLWVPWQFAAGSLVFFVVSMIASFLVPVPLSAIDYKGQPAGYAAQPGEVVNYVENHDNQTLFDVNVFKLPVDTTPRERARVQLLALALNAFSQGTAYFHAGGELLRSKSLDRNSFDSGDWFNRIDWSARDNHFGTGLPRAADNAREWDLMRPLLADASIDPAPADIAFTRDVFLDLLRIRDSSTLFRLHTAADVKQRLRFHNTGPGQDPVVIAGHLDGRGYPGATFAEVLYLVNVAPEPHAGQAAEKQPAVAERAGGLRG